MRGAGPIIGMVAAIACCDLLGGCAETQLATATVKQVTAEPAPAARGTYKIGDPYEIDGVWYTPREDYNYDETGVASWYGPNFHGRYTANGEIFDQNDVTAAHRTLPLPSIVRVTNLQNGRSLVIRVNDRGPYVHGRIIDLSRRSAQLLGFEGSGTAMVRVQVLADESRALKAEMLARGAEPPPPAAVPRAIVVASVLPPPGPQPAAPAPPAPPVGIDPPPPMPTAVGSVEELDHQPIRMMPVKGNSQMYIQAGAFAQNENARRLSASLAGIAPARISTVRSGAGTLFRVRIGPIPTVDQADDLLERVIHSGHPEARIVVD